MIQPKSPLTQQHYDCLDGLRAVLALYVVVYHAWIGIFIPKPVGVSHYFVPLAFGRYAVCFFIILSGFCLMLPTLKHNFRLSKGIWHFIQRRAWRILPPYYFALLLSVLTDLPVNGMNEDGWNIFLPVTIHNLLMHVFLVHNFGLHDFYKINAALWSIAVEWQIYFLFPLLLAAWRFLGPVFATLSTVLFSLLLEYQLIRHFDLQPCSHFVGLFTLGMMAAYVSTSARYADVSWRLIAAFAIAAFISSLYTTDQPLMDTMFGFVGASLLVVIFLHPEGWLHRGLNWKPLVFIGSFSYSLYLMHAPILQILWLCTFSSMASHPNAWCLLLIFLGTPLALAVSYLFYLCCEKPFLQIRERKIIHVR